jgi:uncharacterized protein YdbL (DUF1318 family)
MSRKFLVLLICLAVVTTIFSANYVWSQGKYTIKEMTPEVSAALENRKGRYDQLQILKKQKAIGENNQGYVVSFTSSEEVKGLVEMENADRSVIYNIIASQNGLTDAIDTIEKIFAQTQRDKAEAGDRIQLEDGGWVTK